MQANLVLADNYADGRAYYDANGDNTLTAASGGFGYGMMGYVCCMQYGSYPVGKVSGTVIDEVGSLVNNAKVTLTVRAPAGADPGDVRTTYTDANGAYYFCGVPSSASAYVIEADRVHNSHQSSLVTVTAGTSDASNITVPAIVCTRAGANLVKNPGFEFGTQDGYGDISNPTNWTHQPSGDLSIIGQKGRFGHDDGFPGYGWKVGGHTFTHYGGHVINGVGNIVYGKVTQVVQVVKGQSYNIGAFVSTWMSEDTAFNHPGGAIIPDRLTVALDYDLNGGTTGTLGDALSGNAVTPFGSIDQWQIIKYNNVVATTSSITVILSYNMNMQALGGYWCASRFDEVSVEQATGLDSNSIGFALGLTDGSPVLLKTKPITANFSEAFYIEEMDRSAGIKVKITPPATCVPNRTVDVKGVISTDTNGERIVTPDLSGGLSTPVIAAGPYPIFMTNKALGGAAFGPTNGVWQGVGLYNVGKLVTCYGYITARGSNYFYIDDGTNLSDGSGNMGVRVDVSKTGTNLSVPDTSKHNAIVTGNSTMTLIGSHFVRTIRPYSNINGYTDIVAY